MHKWNGHPVFSFARNTFLPGICLNQCLEAGGDPGDVLGELRHVDEIVFAERRHERLGRQLHDVEGLSVHAARTEI